MEKLHQGWETVHGPIEGLGLIEQDLRMRVPGGWLYKSAVWRRTGWLWGRSTMHVTMAFVPDPPAQ